MSQKTVFGAAVLVVIGAAVWISIASQFGPTADPNSSARLQPDRGPQLVSGVDELQRVEADVTAQQPAAEDVLPSDRAEQPLELPEPPANPEDWSPLQWRRFYMTKYYRRIDWDAEPGANGDLGRLYRRALATLEDARGTGPLPTWDPDHSLLVPLGIDPDNDRLVVLINDSKYRFYPEVYPELREWYNASQVGWDPSIELPPGANRSMSPETRAIIKARAEEALLLLPGF